MLLAALGTFAISVLIMSQWQRFETFSQVQVRPHGMLMSLAGEIEHVINDEQALVALLQNNEMSQFGEVYLIEPSGRDILGRAIPQEILTSAPNPDAGLIRNSDPDQTGLVDRPAHTDSRLPPIMARAIRTFDDEMYFMIFVFDAPGHPFWTLFRWFGLTWVLIAAIVVSGILSAWLANIVIRPIKSLVSASRRQGDGQLDTYIDEVLLLRRDEIGELARQLKMSAEKIRDLLQQQKEFLRDVSHEVRTPLARLQVAAESVELDASDEQSVQRIQREVQLIDQLVHDLLHLSLSDQPLSAQRVENIAITNVIDGCVEKAQILGKGASISILTDLEHPSTIVEGLPILLERAVDNLLTNAIRHAPPGSTVRICGSTHQSRYILVISDQGPGVPEKDLESIFDPFVRLDSARQRTTGGFGLGLSLVRKIIWDHGGTVQAENIDSGGLRVTLTIPLKEMTCVTA